MITKNNNSYKKEFHPKMNIKIPKGTTIFSGYPGQEEVIAEEDQVIEISEGRIRHNTTEISWDGSGRYKRWVNMVGILIANPELRQLMIKRTNEYLHFLAPD